MKIKRTDLELLMKYLEKEKPETVDVHLNDDNFRGSVGFSFADADSRDCLVKVYSATHNITPDLTKTMKLYTRFPKEGKNEQK
jgi:hypothetical protein